MTSVIFFYPYFSSKLFALAEQSVGDLEYVNLEKFSKIEKHPPGVKMLIYHSVDEKERLQNIINCHGPTGKQILVQTTLPLTIVKFLQPSIDKYNIRIEHINDTAELTHGESLTEWARTWLTMIPHPTTEFIINEKVLQIMQTTTNLFRVLSWRNDSEK